MKLYVIEKNRLLGILHEDDKGYITFKYSPTIDKSEYLPSLEKKENKTKDTLPPIFEALLPEGGKIDTIKVKHGTRYTIEVLLYLKGIHGSFQFLNEKEFSHFKESSHSEIIFKRDKTAILDSQYAFPNILEYSLDIDREILSEHGKIDIKVMGLSGYQNKFGVKLNHDLQKITHDDDSNYFMKPYNPEYITYNFKALKTTAYIPFLAINEHLFMTMARDIGFDVPWSAIVQDGKDFHYIIKRFDRYNNASIDHCDAGVLMNLLSGEKYKPTFEKLFVALKEHLSMQELFKAYKFIIFSIIIAHGDLHAKNISIIRSHNQIKGDLEYFLAPLYDVSTTCLYKSIYSADIGLKIDGKNKKINRNDLIKFGIYCGFEEASINKSIDEIADFFLQKFENYINLLPVPVQTLPFADSRYRTKTLKEMLYKYFTQRKEYIYEFIKAKEPLAKTIFFKKD